MVGGSFVFRWVALHCADASLSPGSVPQQDVERLDPRGRTPLELAVCLGHLESTRVLLRHSSDPTHCNTQGWTSERSQFLGIIQRERQRERNTPCH